MESLLSVTPVAGSFFMRRPKFPNPKDAVVRAENNETGITGSGGGTGGIYVTG